MPKINVKHETSKDANETYLRIKNFFETDKDLYKIDPKIQCTFFDQKRKGQLHGNQFKGEFSVIEKDLQTTHNSNGSEDSSGCWVEVQIDLPLLLTPFKGKVQEMITKKLRKYLG